MKNFNLAKQLRIIRPAQFFLDVLDVVVLLLLVIKVDVADQVHDIGNIDAVTLHDLNAEVHIIQDRYDFSISFLPGVKHQILALVVLILLLGHDERILIKAELNECLQRLEVFCQLTESDDKLLLVILALHGIDGLRVECHFLELHNHFIELLNKILIARNDNAGGVLTLGEERQRIICPFLEVAVANDDTKRFCFFLDTVRARIGLQQIMILQILVHIQHRELLAVKAGQEHIYDNENVQRLRFLAFDTI